MEEFDIGSKTFFEKAAPTQHRMEIIAAVTVKIADNLGKSDLNLFPTNAVNLIMLVKKQFGIVAKTSHPEIRKLMKSLMSSPKTLDLLDILTRCKVHLQCTFAECSEAGVAAQKHPNDINGTKELIAEARRIQISMCGLANAFKSPQAQHVSKSIAKRA
jgi:hypothetical protein